MRVSHLLYVIGDTAVSTDRLITGHQKANHQQDLSPPLRIPRTTDFHRTTREHPRPRHASLASLGSRRMEEIGTVDQRHQDLGIDGRTREDQSHAIRSNPGGRSADLPLHLCTILRHARSQCLGMDVRALGEEGSRCREQDDIA